jgi:hypothetical protein
MPKRRHRTKVTEKPVFTFRQMERVVDLIDRQARLLTGEKVLPSDDYVYAKNQHEFTYFYYDSTSNTYYFTLKARYPAIENYYVYNREPYYTDGVVGVYYIFGAARYRIVLSDYVYAKFNPDDANPDNSTITFYNISATDIKNMYDQGYIGLSDDSKKYISRSSVDYHRDHRAGEDPS